MPRHRHSLKRMALKFYEYVKGCSGSQLIRVNMEAGNRAFVLNVILSGCSQGTTRHVQSFRALRTAFSGWAVELVTILEIPRRWSSGL